VHNHNVVFTYTQSDEIMQVFHDWTAKHHAVLHSVTQTRERQSSGLDFSGVPKYQERNWLLAYKAYRYLVERDGVQNLTSKALTKTLQSHIPGRMDIRQLQGKTIVMDGAHNFQKMLAFVDSFRGLYPGVKPAVVIALKHDKEYREVADLLVSFAAQVITTNFLSSQDLPVKSMDPHVLAKAFAGRVPVQVVADPLAATRALLQSPEPVGVITGSFYLLNQIRNNIDLLWFEHLLPWIKNAVLLNTLLLLRYIPDDMANFVKFSKSYGSVQMLKSS